MSTRYGELLDDLRRRRKLPSDYAAAKTLGINQARLHDYRKGNRTPDAYACTRIAVELGLDPLTLIAEIEKETEKNPVRRDFWRDFFLAAVRKKGMLVLICTVFCATALQTSESYANALIIKADYAKRYRSKAFFSVIFFGRDWKGFPYEKRGGFTFGSALILVVGGGAVFDFRCVGRND